MSSSSEPTITELTSGADVKNAYEELLPKLPEMGGFHEIAKNVQNGMPMLFPSQYKKGTRWYKLVLKAEDGVWGLLRMEIREDSVHIDNVVAVTGTKFLVLFANAQAMELGKLKVHLSTADKGLVGYYKRLGFEMVDAKAETGEMERLAS